MGMPNIAVRSRDLFPDSTPSWRYETGSASESLDFLDRYMPALATSSLPRNIAESVQKAHRNVVNAPRVGIRKDPDGVLPVTMEKGNPPYLGVTRIRDTPTKKGYRPRASSVSLNASMPQQVTLGNTYVDLAEEVSEHEFFHVRSAELEASLKDVTRHTGTLVMESFAEYGRMKAFPHKKGRIMLMTPYTPAIKFGYMADKFYSSPTDGARGYEALIRDMQDYGSARKVLRFLGENIKAAVDRGVDIVGAVEKTYRNDLLSALKKHDIKPRYAN